MNLGKARATVALRMLVFASEDGQEDSNVVSRVLPIRRTSCTMTDSRIASDCADPSRLDLECLHP